AAVGLVREGRYVPALWCLFLPAISLIVAAALSAGLWLPMFQVLADVHRQPTSIESQLSEGAAWLPLVRSFVFPQSALGSAGKSADIYSFGFTGLAALGLAVAAPFFKRSAPVVWGCIVGLLSLGMAIGLKPWYVLLRNLLPYFGTFHAAEG